MNHLGMVAAMEQEQYKFDVKISRIIKGITIMIMVFHHLFANAEWLVEGNYFISIPMREHSLEYYIAVYGKICISIYAFLSGYGWYASYQCKKPKCFTLVKRVLMVLTHWWLIVLLCFLPLAIMSGQQTDWRMLRNNLLLVEHTWCPFADYLLFYVTAIISFPMIYRVLKKINKPLLFFIGTPLIGMILRKFVSYTLPAGMLYQLVYFYLLYIPYIVAGSCVYQSGVFFTIHKWLREKKWNKTWIKVVLLFLSVPLRWVTGNRLVLDSFLATYVVFLLVELIQGREGKKFFRGMDFLGRHSTNIWFLHAAFFFSFAEYTQWIIYLPRIPLVIMLWCIILCLPVSWLINLLHDKIFALWERQIKGS